MNQEPYPYMPFFQMNPMNQNFNNSDLLNRVERLEKQIKRLESRVYHLEDEKKHEFTSLSKEYIKDDDGLYMV